MKMQKILFESIFFWGCLFHIGFAAVEKFVPKNHEESVCYSFISDCIYRHKAYRGSGRAAALYLKDVQEAFLTIEPARRQELLTYADDGGWTALHSVVLANNYVELFFLLRLGADLALKTKEGETPYDIACRQNAREAKKLIKIHVHVLQVSGQVHKKNKARAIWKLFNDNALSTKSCIDLLITLSAEERIAFENNKQTFFDALDFFSFGRRANALFILCYLQMSFSDELYERAYQQLSYEGTLSVFLNMYQSCFQLSNKEAK